MQTSKSVRLCSHSVIPWGAYAWRDMRVKTSNTFVVICAANILNFIVCKDTAFNASKYNHGCPSCDVILCFSFFSRKLYIAQAQVLSFFMYTQRGICLCRALFMGHSVEIERISKLLEIGKYEKLLLKSVTWCYISCKCFTILIVYLINIFMKSIMIIYFFILFILNWQTNFSLSKYCVN